jgi:hypothetical protein
VWWNWYDIDGFYAVHRVKLESLSDDPCVADLADSADNGTDGCFATGEVRFRRCARRGCDPLQAFTGLGDTCG